MSDQVYRAVAEDSVDAMFIACGKETVFANRAMAALLGVNGPEALVGRDASAWVEEPEREGFVRRVQSGQDGSPQHCLGLSFRRVDGGVRRVEASVSPIDYLGRPASLFICRDITERKASEERSAEKERTKAQIVYTATHDLKNPLTSIKGYVEILQAQLGKGGSGGPQMGQMLGVVVRSAERMDALLNDLLEMLRIVDGRIESSMAEHDVAGFLRQVAEEMAPALSRRRQSLNVESEVRSLVFGQRLLQVLRNLVDNSSKFSPEDSIITVRVEKAGGAARFSVADEGIGLSPEDVPKLFKPFPGIAKQGAYEGTGLGLAICKGIVELHGGEIWAESPGVGKGSTFYFTIPLNLPKSLKSA